MHLEPMGAWVAPRVIDSSVTGLVTSVATYGLVAALGLSEDLAVSSYPHLETAVSALRRRLLGATAFPSVACLVCCLRAAANDAAFARLVR